MKINKALGLLACSALTGNGKSSFLREQDNERNKSIILNTEVTAGHGSDDCAILSIYTPKEVLEYKEKENGEVDVIEGELGDKFGFELPNAIMSCSGLITKGEMGDSKVYDNQELHKYAHSDEDSKYKAHYHVTGSENFVSCVAGNIQSTQFKFKEGVEKISNEAKKICKNAKWVERISSEEDKGVCI